MGIEIERKFLVVGEGWKTGRPLLCQQGYLSLDKRRTVRVRVVDDIAMITIKGMSIGATRAEYEYEIPLDDGQELLAMCEPNLIEKHRFQVFHAGMKWEVDEFLGDNQGLIVAEIELAAENQKFEKPDWLSTEVTDDPKYFNSQLSVKPYSKW